LTTTEDLYACESKRNLIHIYTINNKLGSLEVTCIVLYTANHYSRKGWLTDHHSSAWRLTCDWCAGGSLGLRFCNLYDQAGSQQHKVGSHGGRRPQVERPECWLEPSPRACRGGGTQTLTPKSHDPCIGFSQAPEHAEGEGLLHDKGEGRTQDTADDCLS
jgi:hypothetical protein